MIRLAREAALQHTDTPNPTDDGEPPVPEAPPAMTRRGIGREPRRRRNPTGASSAPGTSPPASSRARLLAALVLAIAIAGMGLAIYLATVAAAP
jgi:hypothetical protein